MRGSPPVHLALLLVGFILLGIPLVQLTSGGSVQRVEVKVESSDEVPTTLRVRWAHKPERLRVKLGERDLLAGAELTANPVETSVRMILPKDGIELQVEAAWAAGTPATALTLELEPDALEAQSQTRWSSGESLSEIIVYQWKP